VPGAKATQTMLDVLDRSYAAADIESVFMPNVRKVLDPLPEACGHSIAHAAQVFAESNRRREIPEGYGRPFVRHFSKRSVQLESIVGLSIEYRFALIELTLMANIASRWTDSSVRRVNSAASHKEYVRQVAQAAPAVRIEPEQWRRVVTFLLASSSSSVYVIRNLAYALVWCGYFSPDGSRTTDKHVAQQLFVDRAEFVRFRQEALRLLSSLLEFSLLPSAGGMP
jgi:hypothetical protein